MRPRRLGGRYSRRVLERSSLLVEGRWTGEKLLGVGMREASRWLLCLGFRLVVVVVLGGCVAVVPWMKEPKKRMEEDEERSARKAQLLCRWEATRRLNAIAVCWPHSFIHSFPSIRARADLQ